jgi:hypothetical protein
MGTSTTYMLSPTLLWVLLAVTVGAWIVASWVLTYHWKTYTKNNRVVNRTLKIYYIVSICIFIVMGILIVTL